MELGPIQKQWIQSLKDHPERQYKHGLGVKISKDNYLACCLGELCIIAGTFQWSEDGNLMTPYGDKEYPTSIWRKLGLYNDAGISRDGTTSLSLMNDNGLSWPKIAEKVEENPSNYFKKSF